MFECVNCKKMEIWTDMYDGKFYIYFCSACGYEDKRKEERID